MREGPGVDKILDLHTIDVPSDSVGTVLCFDTLEHVEYPRKALEEIHRILMPNGTVVISSVMDFPIHDYPNDYWRFTPEAFKSLLKPFSDAFVGFQGKNSFPHTVVGIGFKGDTPPLMEFKEQYQDWQRAERRSITRLALDITPPILVPAISYFYRVATRLKRRTTEYPRN